MKLQEGIRAQASRTLEHFHKTIVLGTNPTRPRNKRDKMASLLCKEAEEPKKRSDLGLSQERVPFVLDTVPLTLFMFVGFFLHDLCSSPRLVTRDTSYRLQIEK